MDAEWSLLVTSWQLSLEANGHALNTRMTYRKAVKTWLAEHYPDVGPVGLGRDHVRG